MSNYDIGGNIEPMYEGMSEIPNNRTLIATKLTDKESEKPEIILGLKNIEAVFEHFKPSIEVEIQDEENQKTLQTFKFQSIEDFGINGLTSQSELLKNLTYKKEIFEKIAKQVKTNRLLSAAVTDKDTKEALLACLIALRNDLDLSF